MSTYNYVASSDMVYDIYGNVIGSSSYSDGGNSGYITDPLYKTINNNHYRLVWHDEFEEKDLNKTFWTDYYLAHQRPFYLSKADYYINNGNLYIRIKRDAPALGTSWDVAVSGIMTGQSNTLHQVPPTPQHDIPPFWGLLTQEGYYECKLKTCRASGGVNGGWWAVGIQDGLFAELPRAEIDFAEIKSNNTFLLPHGVHQQTDTNVTELYRETSINTDLAEDLQTIGILWENGKIVWYINGVIVDTMTINTPQYPMIHLLSLYKRRSGTGWSGDADPTLGDITLQVDYLRIYKKATSVASAPVTIVNYTPITINGNNANMEIDSERGCPLSFQSYVYVNWSDGSRTEHWVKWDAVNDVFRSKISNQESFTWPGYVYDIGTEIVCNVNYN